MAGPINVLFVCNNRKRRSPTAEKIFARDRRMNVRAAGIGDGPSRLIKELDLRWAQLVLVMEKKYAGRLRAAFPNLDPFPPVVSLDIPDDYAFMQEELIQLLRVTVNAALEAHRAAKSSTTDAHG